VPPFNLMTHTYYRSSGYLSTNYTSGCASGTAQRTMK